MWGLGLGRKYVCCFVKFMGLGGVKGAKLESSLNGRMGEPFFMEDLNGMYIYNIAVDLPLSHRA